MIEPNYVMKCVCKRVIDGDTAVFDVSPGFNVIMQGLTFRFNGINAPELKSSNEATAAKAKEAREFVRNRIEGKEVFVQFTKNTADQEKIDKYGRYLAVVFYEAEGLQVNLNDQLVRLGLAKVYKL